MQLIHAENEKSQLSLSPWNPDRTVNNDNKYNKEVWTGQQLRALASKSKLVYTQAKMKIPLGQILPPRTIHCIQFQKGITGGLLDNMLIYSTEATTNTMTQKELLICAWFTSWHGPLTRYVKLRIAHEPGMPGTFSPPLTSGEFAN